MFEKKDPGKFTIRFNEADPQQRKVIELLNQQGRYKAQFLTNAVLQYVQSEGSCATPDVQVIEQVVRDLLNRQQSTLPTTELPIEAAISASPTPLKQAIDHEGLGDADRDAIRKTLEAFQP